MMDTKHGNYTLKSISDHKSNEDILPAKNINSSRARKKSADIHILVTTKIDDRKIRRTIRK